ncbi:MAG: hypothetical protein OXQ99_00550, partial [Chloroflexota bacterium]|nr:hypothetical protein [Chloroflexota bacterium]
VIVVIAVIVIMVISVVVIVVIGMVVIVVIAVIVIMVISVVVIMVVIGVLVIMVIAMFVIVVIGMVVIVVVAVVIVVIMPAAGAKGDNPNTSRGVDQVAAFASAFHRGQQGLFPARPIDEDHISFGHGCQVTGCGRKSMLISADRNQ